ncbi:MAG: TlpA family protein disulfide reductase [Planctomycetota bacterium]|nr:TlpA family protein disulfide reductase [Planctomycetota bacterium]
MRKPLLTLLFCLFASIPALALDLGDSAPAISVDKWVTGEPADPAAIDGNAFYLIEVWSVTCPPCVQSIPLMNALQEKYAKDGFKIISFTTDAAEDVTPFLEQHPIEYSSFIDKEGGSFINYMAADNRTTIPHAFLFDRSGALVWIGNPLDNLESRVQQVISGELNREKAEKIRAARDRLQDAFGAQNVEGMISSLRELQSLEPENGQYYQVHYRILTDLGAGDENDVKALLRDWYRNAQNSTENLVVLSLVAMDQGHPALRDPELALAAAKRAYEMDGPAKLQAGLNLADTYKAIGRIDLAIKTVGELQPLTGDFEEQAMIDAIQAFYSKLQELAKNPEAPFNP